MFWVVLWVVTRWWFCGGEEAVTCGVVGSVVVVLRW